MQADTRRRRPMSVENDKKAYQALKIIADYKPANEDIAVEALEASLNDLETLYEIETQKEKELKAARDNTVAAQHAFHKLVLRAKNQVLAQFGANSNEAQSVGLKKKSEYKQAKRKTD